MAPSTPRNTSDSQPCLSVNRPDPQPNHVDVAESAHLETEPSLKDNLPEVSLLNNATKSHLERNGQRFATTQDKSTPIHQRTGRDFKKDPKRDDHKEDVGADLGPVLVLEDKGAWARSLYLHLVKDSGIDKFLKEANLYSKAEGRWLTVPEVPANETQLYDPFVKIFNVIFVWFVLKFKNKKVKNLGSALRQAINTHSTSIPHQDQYPTTLTSRPDISVRAVGSSFQAPEPEAGKNTSAVGFCNMSSFMEVKLQRKITGAVKDHDLQVSVYVRQIFIQQPNRRFVRVLLLTEKSVCLFHFDRCGGMRTDWIDLHEDPHTFIRLVVGLNWHEDTELGFDTSIKWTIKKKRKVGGTLTTRRPDNTEIVYDLCKIDPVIAFYDICGRANQCWSVCEPNTGVRYLVSDCWRSEDRVSEHIRLEEAHGLPGVVQMISYEPNRGETKDFRGTLGASHEEFHNRIAIRIVLDTEGESIQNFKSPKELLCALRDAIIGHMKLYLKDMVHRNVSMENIVLGRKVNNKVAQGHCGALIDLHLVIEVARDTNTISVDLRTGSRMYSSIAMLQSCKAPDDPSPTVDTPAQGHLDDLESFLYIYNHIIHKYDWKGAEFPLPYTIAQWERASAQSVAQYKFAFLSMRSIRGEVSSRWPKPCIDLLNKLRRFFFTQADEKEEILHGPAQDRDERTKELTAAIVEHYETVLLHFDTAIRDLETGEHSVTTGRLPAPNPDPNSPTTVAQKNKAALQRNPVARTSLKRPQEEYPDDIREAKRNLPDSEAETTAENELVGLIREMPQIPRTPAKGQNRPLLHGPSPLSKS